MRCWGVQPSGIIHTCEWEESLGEVLTRLLQKRVYRLFVVDKRNAPVGVISLSDILLYFVKEKL